MGWMGGAPPTTGADSGRLFAAGITYICCEAWPQAYDCFVRSAREDAPTRYNQALCCFHVGWYEEGYRLLAEAERLLDDKPGKGSCPGIPFMSRRQPPEAFRRWDTDGELPRSPLLPETPRDDALTLILRLRAEAAFRLDAARRCGRLPPASDTDTNTLKTCSKRSTDDTAPGTL